MFAENLRKIRTERNMSQTDLAHFCGISKTMISNYEKGKNIPKGKSLKKLTTSLDLSEEELFGSDYNSRKRKGILTRKSDSKVKTDSKVSTVKDRIMDIIPCDDNERCAFCRTRENVSKINIGNNDKNIETVCLCDIHQKRLVKKIISNI